MDIHLFGPCVRSDYFHGERYSRFVFTNVLYWDQYFIKQQYSPFSSWASSCCKCHSICHSIIMWPWLCKPHKWYCLMMATINAFSTMVTGWLPWCVDLIQRINHDIQGGWQKCWMRVHVWKIIIVIPKYDWFILNPKWKIGLDSVTIRPGIHM